MDAHDDKLVEEEGIPQRKEAEEDNGETWKGRHTL